MERKPLLLCRPVDLDMTNKIDELIMQMTEKYKDSVESICDACACSIWIGPRSQIVLPISDKICFRCAFVAMGDSNAVMPELIHLGNPEFD